MEAGDDDFKAFSRKEQLKYIMDLKKTTCYCGY